MSTIEDAASAVVVCVLGRTVSRIEEGGTWPLYMEV
jgi:hypothetical protein